MNNLYLQITSRLVAVLRNDRGASLVEYALLVALIALACIAGVTFFGDSLSSSYDGVGSSLA